MLVARQIILKRNYYAMDYNVKLNLKKKRMKKVHYISCLLATLRPLSVILPGPLRC